MNSPLKLLQMLRIALMATVVLYAVIGETQALPAHHQPNPIVLYALAFVAITDVVLITAIRRMMVAPLQSALAGQATEPNALNRWRAGYIVTYALSEAIALFGFVLRFMGFGFSQVAAFYLASMILFLFFSPRLPSGETA